MVWIFYALSSAACAALATIFNKLLVHKTDLLVGTFVRSIIIALLFFIFILGMRKEQLMNIRQFDLATWGVLIVTACAGAFTLIFSFLALKNGPTSQVAALSKFSLLFVMFFAGKILNEAIPINVFIGIALIFVGLVYMSF